MDLAEEMQKEGRKGLSSDEDDDDGADGGQVCVCVCVVCVWSFSNVCCVLGCLERQLAFVLGCQMWVCESIVSTKGRKLAESQRTSSHM